MSLVSTTSVSKMLVSRGARCEGVCLLGGVGYERPNWLVVVPAGAAVVASMVCSPTRHVVVATSPCPVIVGESPVKAVSPVVPGAEASLSWCPVLPVNGLLEDKTKSPCGRGSIVVYKNRL